MHWNANTLALLPEGILTFAGVLVMMTEPMLKPRASRKPLGWLAVLATLLAGVASAYQLHVFNLSGSINAFSSSIRVDPFSIFFHLLIASVVLVSLLGSLDYFEGEHGHAGEYFALVLFGAVGMMLMTCSVELLMVFVGLEISSISTYILAGFRKGKATGAESSIKYFLLGSFATAFFLYGIALVFGATGSTSIASIATALGAGYHRPRQSLAFLALGDDHHRPRLQKCPPLRSTYGRQTSTKVRPRRSSGMMSTAPKAAAFAVLLRISFTPALAPLFEHRWAAL